MTAERHLHLTGLNGIRALAALAVLASHLSLWSRHFGFSAFYGPQLGAYAVTVFFALSGFLITRVLLLERERQSLHLGKFYLRRILRIWPLYFAYLAIVVVYLYMTAPGVLPGSLVYYVLPAANVAFARGQHLPFLGHYWSLGVEQQFYLFWPWILRSARRPLVFAGWFALSFILVRWISGAVPSLHGAHRLLQLSRFDCLAIGAVGALLSHQQRQWCAHWLLRTWLQAACWCVLGLAAVNRFSIPFIGHDIVAAATVCIIVAQVERKSRIINLDHPLVEFVGKLSYGVYVLHPPIILLCAHVIRELSLSRGMACALGYGSVLVLTLVVAYCSHVWLERPFLQLKARYAAPRASGPGHPRARALAQPCD